MELFYNAKRIRLRANNDKFLTAEDDGEGVVQGKKGDSRRARWVVEYVESGEGVGLVRLKSCFDKYLTAIDDDFLLGAAGKKVKQTLPRRLGSSVEWEPVRDGMQVKLKTRYGNFLKANRGIPPYRNLVTHDIPNRSRTQEWILWDIDVLETYPNVIEEKKEAESSRGGESEPRESETEDDDDDDDEPFSFQSFQHPTISESDGPGPSRVKNEGRVIHYNIVGEDGNIVEGGEGERSLLFKGSGVEELTRSLEEETGLTEITLCSRSPLNGKLYPMQLALPPNHVKLHVYIVTSSSKAAAAAELG